ncbi:MAG: hypothetical protein J5933_06660 [Clostridia bacterium]|nr:hypothetical protein [Clostridia bacterium]
MKRIITVSLVLLMLAALLWAGYNLYREAASDGTPPVISFDSDTISLSINADSSALLAGVSATDAEDGDLTLEVFIESISRKNSDGSVTVTYVVFDDDKNAAKATRKLFYTDYTPPVFSLSAPLIGTVSNISELAGLMHATDCIDGDLSSVVKVTYLDRMTTSVGTYPVEFRVTNSLGDTEYLETELECAPAGFNNAEITLSDYLIYVQEGSSFDPVSYVSGYKRDGVEVTGADGLTISSGVNTSVPGVYAVSYIYDAQNSSSHTRLIVIVTGAEEASE